MNKFIQFLKISFISILFISCHNNAGTAQDTRYGENTTSDGQTVRQQERNAWVDSVYNTLTLDEKIGQLFMIAAYSGGENYNVKQITELIKTHKIGGLIFMQGTPEAQAQQTNTYQSISKVPLLIGMDAEWGLGMRLTGVKNFSRQMMLGATRDYQLVYELGEYIAQQCHIMGVHINFAPVIDVNNNPNNPVINFRSFGEDKDWVSKLGIAYMNGLQMNRVIACAKHFPGHGDVEVDSHLDLPVINKSRTELDNLEFFPFQKLSNAGVASIMIAHLSIPALERDPLTPTTLSYQVITKLLKEEFGYNGLIITDALNMKGITKHFSAGDIDLKAFEAGNDILLFSQDVPLAINKIKKAILSGSIPENRLEYSVKKILHAKYNAGLNVIKILGTENLTEKLNANVDYFNARAADLSITVINDEHKILEKMNVADQKIAYLSINGDKSDFYNILIQKYPQITQIKSTDVMKDYDVVITGIHNTSLYPGKSNQYGLTAESLNRLEQIKNMDNTIVIVFGNAYVSKFLCNHKSVIVTYEENTATYDAALKLLSGQIKPRGVLPVTVCQSMK